MNMASAAMGFLFGISLVLLSGCGGGGEGDSTDREITGEDLSLMLLAQADLGAEYAGFEFDEDHSGYLSNEEWAEDAFDPEDEARDIEKFGRVSGYQAGYFRSQALLEEKEPFRLEFRVHLFADANGASGYAADSIADVQEQLGRESEGMVVREVTPLDVGKIGDETVAVHQKVVVEDPGHDQLALYATFVGFRKGRILGAVAMTGLDDEDVSSEVATLARKLHDRIQAVLRGDITPTPSATP